MSVNLEKEPEPFLLTEPQDSALAPSDHLREIQGQMGTERLVKILAKYERNESLSSEEHQFIDRLNQSGLKNQLQTVIKDLAKDLKTAAELQGLLGRAEKIPPEGFLSKTGRALASILPSKKTVYRTVYAATAIGLLATSYALYFGLGSNEEPREPGNITIPLSEFIRNAPANLT